MTKIPITWIFDYFDKLPNESRPKDAIRDLIIHLYKRIESENSTEE